MIDKKKKKELDLKGIFKTWKMITYDKKKTEG